MDDLAARIEALTGPDRALFCRAWETIKGTSPTPEAERFLELLNVKAWEQAAMMLVPEGWNWMAGERDQGRCRAYVNNGELLNIGSGLRRNPDSVWCEVVAATPALALCAAALRAKEASNG